MPSNSPWSTLILIALMVVAFYLLILRPQKKRQQAQAKTMTALVPGVRVLLTSGIFGTITSIGTKQAVIETSPGVELTVLKQAIVRVAADADEEPVDPSEDDLVADDLAGEYAVGQEATLEDDRRLEPDGRDLRDGDLADRRDGDLADREPPAGAEPTTRRD